MSKKAYVSNRFPYLNIADKAQFQDGVCETESEDVQALIEGHDWYGVHIHPRDVPPPAEPAAEAPEPAATEESEHSGGFRARHGQRGSR